MKSERGSVPMSPIRTRSKHATPSLIFGLILGVSTACTGDEVPTATGPDSNLAPVVLSPNATQSAVAGVFFSYDATQSGTTFSDADGDALSYTATYEPEIDWMSMAGGVLVGTPPAVGTVEVTIHAADGHGGTAVDRFDLIVSESAIDQDAVLVQFEGRIDLENLTNYANVVIPSYIQAPNDGGNPVTDAGATLGRVLFYDKALSIDNTVACASCHIQTKAFGDDSVVSDGVDGGVTGRHSMRLINTAYADETRFFWDERAASHEAQETQPLQDHNEHGFSGLDGRPGFEDLVTKLEGIEYYNELFTFVFGDTEVTEERLQLALAQFTKSIVSFDSRYDEGRAQVGNDNAPFPNFTADENRGKTLFLGPPQQGNAGCGACHQPPEFAIDPNTRHNGVVGVANDPTAFDFTNTRSPTLRDMVAADGTAHGSFMHDGSLATVRAVIDHYDSIEVPSVQPAATQFLNTLAPRLLPGGNPQNLNLTGLEKAQIEAFLRTLTGVNVYTDEKWSDPFGG